MKRALALLGAGGLSLALTGCWQVPHQNADRTSHNPFEQALTVDTVEDLQEAWRWDAEGTVAGPVVSSGGVHVVNGCGLFTLDAATGAERWRQPILDDTSVCGGGIVLEHAGSPYVSADGERVVGSYGLAHVRAPGYLETQWSTREFAVGTGEPSPAGTTGVGFVGAQRGTQLAGLVTSGVGPALQATNVELAGLGRTFRTSIAQASAYYPAEALTLGDDTVFHVGSGILATTPGDGTQGHAVRAYPLAEERPGCGPVSVPPAPGSYTVECPVWVRPTDGRPTPAVIGPGGDTLYVRTTAGTLYAVDAATGAVRWTAGGFGAAGMPALAGGTLYVPTGDGRIVTFPAAGCGAATCSPTGEFATGATSAVSTPAVAGDVLYATAGGSVVAFDAAGCPAGGGPCAPLWSAAGEGSPVVSNGRVYVHSGAGLVAYALP